MRVVRVIGVLEPGGAQLSVLRLACAQAALGVQTRLLCGDATVAGIALARQFGYEVEAFRMHVDIGHSRCQWTPEDAFARWIQPRLGAADLIHAHMFGAWWAVAQVVGEDVPVLASEHNAYTWPLGDHTEAAAAASSRIDGFFAHGLDASVFLHRLGVDIDRIRPGRSAVSLHATPRPGLLSPRLSFTGRFREDKGPDLLVHALAAMRDPPASYLVGDGPMRRSLTRLIDRQGLRRIVRLPGWSHEPARYVAGAAVHVVPSREEAWSQSAVTALALGVPVVGTAVDGLRLTLGQGRGLLVAGNDPGALAVGIQTVLDGGGSINSAEGRRYAAGFQAADVAAAYFAVYQEALEKTRPDSPAQPTASGKEISTST